MPTSRRPGQCGSREAPHVIGGHRDDLKWPPRVTKWPPQHLLPWLLDGELAPTPALASPIGWGSAGSASDWLSRGPPRQPQGRAV